MNKRPDKADTQEIKLPKSKYDYGDNFEGEIPKKNSNSQKSKQKNSEEIPFYRKLSKNQLTVISICALIVLIVIGIVFISLSSSKVVKKDETTFPSFKTTVVDKKAYTNPVNNEYYTEQSTTKYTYTEESTSQDISTEIVTSMQPTTQVIATTNNIETTETPTVSFETETETIPYVEKSLAVDDISIIKTDDNLFICNANGTFKGYSEEEILNLISVSSTSGTPVVSSPSLNESIFSFYISLNDECDGELCIHFGNYDYYQPISSMK